VNFTRAILHCAATPYTKPGEPGFNGIGVSQIRAWHKARGFSDVGYHFVVKRDGTISPGRSLFLDGAHTKGHNDALGVCLVGTLDFTHAQVKSLLTLARLFYEKYDLRPEHWFCHYQFNEHKTCPNIPVEVLRRLLKGGLARG